jgi:CheY-like chemotaxis protein
MRTRSIILVDDDLDDHEIFRTACAVVDSSINVISYENGEVALNELESMENLPDYIFLDLNMPRLNGIEVLGSLKKMENIKSIPVVIYTTSFDSKVRGMCADLGALDIIEKPNSFDVLCQKLEDVLKIPV